MTIIQALGHARTLFAASLVCTAFISGPSFAQGHLQAWGSPGLTNLDVPAGPGFIEVSAGSSHNVAMRSDGSLTSWGSNGWNQVGGTPAGVGFVDIDTGIDCSFAVSADGSINAWGRDDHLVVSGRPTGTGFTQVAAGGWTAYALRANGSIAAWGYDNVSQVTSTPTGSGYLQIDSHGTWAMAIRADTSIEAWGFDWSGTVSNPPSGTGFTQFSAGSTHGIALRSDGTLVSWGNNSYGQVGYTPSGADFVAVAAGRYVSAALRSDGTLETWGHNGDWDILVDTPAGPGGLRVDAGSNHFVVIRDENPGGGYCFGDGSAGVCPCNGFSNAQGGCLNSSGITGAELLGTGFASIASDSFQLHVSGVPGNKAGLLFRGANQLANGNGFPLAAGLYCTGGSSIRSQVQITAGGGTTFSDFLGGPYGASSFGAGEITTYQYWYRDPGNPCSGEGYNFSNAWEVSWLP